MTEKTPPRHEVEPCAWCGCLPEIIRADDDTDVVACDNSDCVIAEYALHQSVECWNTNQRSIMATRRKDFEAGYSACIENEESEEFTSHCAAVRSEFFDDYIREQWKRQSICKR